jgi:predicted metalloprotease with PDZ domain
MMKRVSAMVVVLALLALPAMAGDKAKCDGNGEDCLKAMKAKYQKKAWLGIEYDTDEHGRWVVKAVEKDSPAALAGFEKGDVLLSLNGEAYTKENKAALKAEYAKLAPGSEATYVVKRQGGKVELQATLGKVPAEMQAKWIAEHMKEHHPEVKMASK